MLYVHQAITSNQKLFFLVAPRHMEFLRQESDLCHSCNLSHTCRNAKTLTYCSRLGIELVIPLSHNGNSSFYIFLVVALGITLYVYNLPKSTGVNILPIQVKYRNLTSL